MRKLTGSRLMVPGHDRGRSRQPRLGVVDIYDLDRQRQLVLLRRDNVEHLLLIGGLNDVVVETNIVRVAGARLPPAPNEAGNERLEPPFEQAPRPQVESARPSIEAQLAAQLGTFARKPSEESDIDEELAPVGSVSAPMPARPEPTLKPDAVTLGAAPSVQGLRAEAKTPDFSSAQPSPAPAASSVFQRPEPRPGFTPPLFPARQAAPPVQPPAPAPPPARPPEPEVVRTPPQPAPAASQGPDAVVLSDMAKQLEETLKRPAQPVPPPPASPPPMPVARDEDLEDEDDGLLEPAPLPDRGSHAPFDDEDEEEFRAADTTVKAEYPSPATEPVRPAPPPAQPAAPSPSRAPEPPPPKPAAKAPDPFSVDEIEAEFARLLGRPLDGGKKE